jgi:chaperonin GroEL (HSP60 family)
MLQHLARLTGGKAIIEGLDIQLRNIQISDLGQAGRITISKYQTVIEGTDGYSQLFLKAERRAHPNADTSPMQSSRTHTYPVKVVHLTQ